MSLKTIAGKLLVTAGRKLVAACQCCSPPPPPPPPPPTGCCCDGCQILSQYTTQQACEECNNTYSCFEELYQDCDYTYPDESGNCPDGFTNLGWLCESCPSCPEGWQPGHWGGDCYRYRNVSSCALCSGSCDLVETTGPCATWKEPCDGCSGGYFQAFDGSNRYFRRLGLYDLDCCYLGSFRPDDGYYILEKCQDGQTRVVESARWYAANGYGVGAVVAPPPVWNIGHPSDSATWRSLGYSDACCNSDGTRVYQQLLDEVNPFP